LKGRSSKGEKKKGRILLTASYSPLCPGGKKGKGKKKESPLPKVPSPITEEGGGGGKKNRKGKKKEGVGLPDSPSEGGVKKKRRKRKSLYP